MKPRRLISLSNVYDEQYRRTRPEPIAPCLSSPKRRDLLKCLQLATGLQPIVLSSPPKALDHRARWLPARSERFDVYPQQFSANFDAAKFRVPLSWFFYARQALRHVRDGDLILIDNYELIYVIAAWVMRTRRKVNFVLDYEDGKHLIDRSVWRLMSGLAEILGRPLMRAAFIAHPSLRDRLPSGLPFLLVPGFISEEAPPKMTASRRVRFLYSGSLDTVRGIDILLRALPHLPPTGWSVEVCGVGPLCGEAARVAAQPFWQDKIKFHGYLPGQTFKNLITDCHIGLNCQKASDRISKVTFPSKLFEYLSAGLLIVSSRASCVEEILGDICLYYDDTPEELARTMRIAISNYESLVQEKNSSPQRRRYSISATAERVSAMLGTAGLL